MGQKLLSRNYLVMAIVVLLSVSVISFGLYQLTRNSSSSNELFISTTTSVENTGLLDYLINNFEENHDVSVKYTAVGSGNAIQLARDGEVDGVLVHAPDLELSLVSDGFAENRTTLWYNYFIIVGPGDDPAGVQTANNATHAFSLLKDAGEAETINFYSRGDQSGTHLKELSIWENASITVPEGSSDWYYELGQGMSATLVTTNDDPIGYTLSDLGTFAKLTNTDESMTLKKLYEGGEPLFNPYSFLVIDEDKFDGIDLNTGAAYEFLEFLMDPDTKQLVRDYKEGNIILFTPIEDRT